MIQHNKVQIGSLSPSWYLRSLFQYNNNHFVNWCTELNECIFVWLSFTSYFQNFSCLRFIASETTCRMSSTEAKAPFPISPQAKVFTCGSIIRTALVSTRAFVSPWLPMHCGPALREVFEKPCMVDKCSAVSGWFHIAVFIAGASKRDFAGRKPWPKSQARITHDTVSSQNPCAILARVWADRGATKRISAQSMQEIRSKAEKLHQCKIRSKRECIFSFRCIHNSPICLLTWLTSKINVKYWIP